MSFNKAKRGQLFNQVKMTAPKRNSFDLSHDVKMSFNMGELIPVLVQDCVPGDRFHLGADALIRFQPLISPVMHRMHCFMHFFFVPNRIVWPNWESFITQDLSTGVHPFPYCVINKDGTNYTKLMDYAGIPNPATINTPTIDERCSVLPFAAYQKIWNDYYRDQNLQAEWPSAVAGLPDGDNTSTADLFTLRQRAWMHDYFTSALPFAQKGDPVDVPLGDIVLKDFPQPGAVIAVDPTTGAPVGGDVQADVGTGSMYAGALQSFVIDPNHSLTSEGITINDLRRAFKLQEFLEKNARGGTRYIENIRAHFGVTSSDRRLQRAEYITGTKTPIMVSEVLSTVETVDLSQGNMSGHALGVTQGKFGSYFCEEHGYIIGIMSVMPDTAYFQGFDRHWLKSDPLDWFWPTFANLGEQEIINKEIYAYTSAGDNTFGYTPRYAEYKYRSSRVAGDFRTSLLFWHIARNFVGDPSLNSTFIQCTNAETDRIFAVEATDVQKLLCHVLIKMRAGRSMPVFGTPTF